MFAALALSRHLPLSLLRSRQGPSRALLSTTASYKQDYVAVRHSPIPRPPPQPKVVDAPRYSSVHKLPSELQKEIKRLRYSEGLSIKDISKKLNVEPLTVSQTAPLWQKDLDRASGQNLPPYRWSRQRKIVDPPNRPVGVLPKETREEIKRLRFVEGRSISDVCQILNVSPLTVCIYAPLKEKKKYTQTLGMGQQPQHM
mmetsp:Transcript_13091/g.22632  ORF Transcript_13091/g.22632 Transcript_13091/m.22632 type:complete len:199 (+) Transcript_13091:35-631(+)